jgi:hypothetical protein
MNPLDRKLQSIEKHDLTDEIAEALIEYDHAWRRWNEADELYRPAAEYALLAARERLNALYAEAKRLGIRAG